MTERYSENSKPLSMSELLKIDSIERITQAYNAAQSVMECLGCARDGKISVGINDGSEYRISCPLLEAKCRHGQELREKLDTHALASILAIPRLPAIFRERLAEPQPTTGVRGVNKWSYGTKTFLLLHGEHGTGKSFAAAYALYVLFRKRLLANWKYPTAWGTPSAMWLGAYRATTKDDLFDAAQVVPLLVLDDLGSEENTQRAKGRISEIISERYNQRRVTILTMNEDALKLQDMYNQRMSDRVIGAGETVYCGGESLRLAG